MAITGNSSFVQVGVAMVLQDRFTQEAGRISQSFRGMMNEARDWNRGISMAIGTAFQSGKEAIGGMYEAYKYSAGIGKDIFLTSKMAGATRKESMEMMQLAKDVNAATPLTAADIASGERFLAMAGNKVGMIKQMVKPAAQLASIFSMPLGGKGGVADMLTNIEATFNIPAEQSARVVDLLGIATTSTNMSLTDLAESLKYAGAEFRNAKYSLGDAAAAIGVLGDQGIQGSSAGTAIANFLRYITLSIVEQRKKGTSALKAMGIDPESLIDAQGNLLKLGDIIQKITDKVGADAATKIISPFFYNTVGVRGTRAISALVHDVASGRNKFKQVTDSFNAPENADWTNRTMEEYMKTPAGKIDALRANFENLIVTVGQTLADVFNPILTTLSTVARWVNGIAENGFGSWAIKIGAGAIMIQTLIQGFRLVYMTTRMISMQYAQMNARQAAGNTGLTSTVALYTAMEAHLRTIVALQMQLVGLQMAPGTRMKLPMGGSLSHTKKGNITASGMPTGMGFGRNPAGYANAIGTGALVGMAAKGAAAGGGAAGAGGAAAGGAVGAGLRGLGGRLLGFLGGPWGIGLSIGIPLILELLQNFTKKKEANDEVQIKKMTEASALQKLMSENLRKNIREGVKEGAKQGVEEGIKNHRAQASSMVNGILHLPGGYGFGSPGDDNLEWSVQ